MMSLITNGIFAQQEKYGDSEIFEETDAERKLRLERTRIKIYKSQGLKEFNINGSKVWALNLKSALKKSKK